MLFFPRVTMQHFLIRSNSAIKRLESLNVTSQKEFNKVAKYFGEKPKNVGMQQFFTIFNDFMRKFEVIFVDVKV